MDKQLPRFFHIGTQKAASSYLFNLLKSHPEISLCPLQDINFYRDAKYNRGIGWYLSCFPDPGIRIDTSPKLFMSGSEAAPRIKQVLGDQQPLFLLILRNPIDYVHSHFQMHLRKGYFKSNPERYPELTENLVEFVRLYPVYLRRGYYAEILENEWFSRFAKQQFKIVVFEELIANTEDVIGEILSFFGLTPMPLSTHTSSKNKMLRYPIFYKMRDRITKFSKLKAFLKRSGLFNRFYEDILTEKVALSEKDRNWMKGIYQDDVARLKDLLESDIPSWGDF